jgi:hypothetical protein
MSQDQTARNSRNQGPSEDPNKIKDWAKAVASAFWTTFRSFSLLWDFFFGDGRRAGQHFSGDGSTPCHTLVRVLCVMLGLLVGIVALPLGVGITAAGLEYVNSLLQKLSFDVKWFLLVPLLLMILIAVIIGAAQKNGTVLGHFIRGAAFPYVLLLLLTVLSVAIKIPMRLIGMI